MRSSRGHRYTALVGDWADSRTIARSQSFKLTFWLALRRYYRSSYAGQTDRLARTSLVPISFPHSLRPTEILLPHLSIVVWSQAVWHHKVDAIATTPRQRSRAMWLQIIVLLYDMYQYCWPKIAGCYYSFESIWKTLSTAVLQISRDCFENLSFKNVSLLHMYAVYSILLQFSAERSCEVCTDLLKWNLVSVFLLYSSRSINVCQCKILLATVLKERGLVQRQSGCQLKSYRNWWAIRL